MTKLKVFVVGLVGGIASGKSTVSRVFAELGAGLIDADKIGHEVLNRPLIARRLRQIFGEQVLASDGSVDRKQLGKLVFGSDGQARARLAQLEEIVHPVIQAHAVRMLSQFKQADPPPPAVVIDAPLLLEAGWAPMCDIIVFIDTPEEIRRERAVQRGWTSDHFAERERLQLSLDEKKAQATHVLNGNTDEKQLRISVKRLLEQMY